MQVPLQVTFRDINRSHSIDVLIREKADKLDRFSQDLIACHVVVELAARRHQDKRYDVRIAVAVPGKELVARNSPAQDQDVSVAVREAFDEMFRQVEDYERRRHRDVKTHSELLQGEVVRLFKEDDFGFIMTPSGEEFYFNANNVVHPSFERLHIGMPVHFIEAMGDEGPQAHRVSAKEKH